MRWYVPVQPPAALDRVLACSWTATPSGMHRLVPDACLDLLWLSHGAIVLCGPETRAWEFALPEGTTAVGVRFRPGVAATLFDTDVSVMRDRRVRLADLVGADLERATVQHLGREGSLTARMHRLERFVADRMRDARGPVPDDDAERILETLAAAPRASAGELAAMLGVTTRQLHRRSLQWFGYGTSMLARLLRFQRFVSLAECAPPARRSLARFAVEAGYTDQAHLARDCRAITGLTPSAYLAASFPTFPDMSDPYKTSATFLATMAS